MRVTAIAQSMSEPLPGPSSYTTSDDLQVCNNNNHDDDDNATQTHIPGVVLVLLDNATDFGRRTRHTSAGERGTLRQENAAHFGRRTRQTSAGEH